MGDSREKRREGEMEGAVAIRKSLQEHLGSSNHEAAICNAYQVTLHFSEKEWLYRENDRSPGGAQELDGNTCMNTEIYFIRRTGM